MRYKSDEYSITNVIPTKDGDVQGICITKKALEEWRGHYRKVASKYKNEPFKWGFYMGKAEVIIDMIKHFEGEEV